MSSDARLDAAPVDVVAGRELDGLLDTVRDRLRPADLVMSSAQLGAARLTRFSFNRSMIRRAFARAWRIERVRFEMDAAGRGHAAYRVDAEGHVLHFVAFTNTLDEADHTDRVVAPAWEITGALVECGELDDAYFDELARLLPLQEATRFDCRVLVLTRGNRSVRFFDSLVDTLASGQQPSGNAVADAGYIMRSTAFYGNGKYGMKSFAGYPDGHPVGAPYRSQMLAAWLFRELSYDVVEECARLRAIDLGATAVPFDDDWSRYFGLGNATGLGLVPYALKHPKVLHTWAGVRELTLARMRSSEATPESLDHLRWWLERAVVHFTDLDAEQPESERPPRLWASPASIAAMGTAALDALDQHVATPLPFDELYRWAIGRSAEASELVVSALLEVSSMVGVALTDEVLDQLLVADESVAIDLSRTLSELRDLLRHRFAWVLELDLDLPSADHFWWVVSDNTEEPRRADRRRIPPEHREVAIDVARQVAKLSQVLDDDVNCAERSIADLLDEHPDLGAAVRRVLGHNVIYGEPQSNVCDSDFLPLDLQRFQLAMYGMDNFSPKSTDWLRVTLNQGAPRISDLNSGADNADSWVWPPRPEGGAPA